MNKQVRAGSDRLRAPPWAGLCCALALSGCSLLPAGHEAPALPADWFGPLLGGPVVLAPGSASPPRHAQQLQQAIGTAGDGVAAPGFDPAEALDRIDALRAARAQGLVITGVRDAAAMALYARVSPSVVLVTKGSSIGSGSVIDASGLVLTNLHVVEGSNEVGVLFKPAEEGAAPAEDAVVHARVVSVDRRRDLALLQLPELPAGIVPVPLGSMDEVRVGADVHAIGHPRGEWWTYTGGVISQLRRDYAWSPTNTADVIQTQTPLNPGNSGGPLLDEAGRLIGVNSFIAEGEGLNFAVAIGEVREFIAAPPSPAEHFMAGFRACAIDGRAEGRSAAGDADEAVFDVDCDGRRDALLRVPDDVQAPITVAIDVRDSGLYSLVIEDRDRDGDWDRSERDIDEDGVADLRGHHPRGQLAPDRTTRIRH